MCIEASVPALMDEGTLLKLTKTLNLGKIIFDDLDERTYCNLCEIFSIVPAFGCRAFLRSTSNAFWGMPADYIDAIRKSLRYFSAVSSRKAKLDWRGDIRFSASYCDFNKIHPSNPRLRNHQVYVDTTGTHASYVPPPPQFLPVLMDDLYGFMLSSHHSACVIARGAYCMLQFLAIHPLADGNGRFSRAIFCRMAGRSNAERLYARILLSVMFVRYIEWTCSAIMSYCVSGNLDDVENLLVAARSCTDRIIGGSQTLMSLSSKLHGFDSVTELEPNIGQSLLISTLDVLMS